MAFIGLLFCMIAIFIIFLRLRSVLTGKLVEGKIVGYVRGGRGTHGMVTYNYRISLKYNQEMYYVTSMDSLTTTDGVIPNQNLGMYCKVYFNPRSPDKKVAMKGFGKLEWITLLLFLAGAFMIFIEIAAIL